MRYIYPCGLRTWCITSLRANIFSHGLSLMDIIGCWFLPINKKGTVVTWLSRPQRCGIRKLAKRILWSHQTSRRWYFMQQLFCRAMRVAVRFTNVQCHPDIPTFVWIDNSKPMKSPLIINWAQFRLLPDRTRLLPDKSKLLPVFPRSLPNQNIPIRKWNIGMNTTRFQFFTYLFFTGI